MSLGDWEHTFKVELLVSVRSKFENPKSEEYRMQDVGQYYGSDGVEITTNKVEYQGTEDLLPFEVREAILYEQAISDNKEESAEARKKIGQLYKKAGLCEKCGENPCHGYCSLQTYGKHITQPWEPWPGVDERDYGSKKR